MEFNSDQMVLAHAKWKTRLKGAIVGSESIDIASSERDDHCDLGKWLISDGRRFEQLAPFQDLKTKHTRFHSSVGGVLRKIQSCSQQEASALIDPVTSEFGKASSACVNAIVALRQAIAKS